MQGPCEKYLREWIPLVKVVFSRLLVLQVCLENANSKKSARSHTASLRDNLPKDLKWFSPECLFYKSAWGMQIRRKVRVRTPLCWGTTHQKIQEKWRQKWSAFVERDKEFVLCISGRGAVKIVIDFTEELNHNETYAMCQNRDSSTAQCQISRSRSVVQQNLQWGFSSA